MPFADVNGVRLYYEIYGDGEPVVFIHGVAITSKVWDFQREEIGKHFKMIVYDLRGSGKSSKTPKIRHTAELLCDDLKALLDHLDINCTHIMGLSLGAAVAMKFAIKYPGMVKKLMLSGAFIDLDGLLNIIRTYFPYLVGRLLMTKFFGEIATKIMLPSASREELLYYHRKIISIDKDEVVKYNQILGSYRITHALGRIKSPVYITYGQHEKILHKYGKMIAQHIPGAVMEVIPGVGHGWNGEAPELFNKKVLDFFKE